MMLVKTITWFGNRAVVACDGNCRKAWGINRRPSVEMSDNEDDTADLADHELGDAPVNPGTYEGGDAKPTDYTDPRRQNKWCCRECERSRIVVDAGEVTLPDYSRRVCNIPGSDPGEGGS